MDQPVRAGRNRDRQRPADCSKAFSALRERLKTQRDAGTLFRGLHRCHKTVDRDGSLGCQLRFTGVL